MASLLSFQVHAQSQNFPYGTLLLVPCGDFESQLVRDCGQRNVDFTKSKTFRTEPE
jgi:hypothetical protein